MREHLLLKTVLGLPDLAVCVTQRLPAHDPQYVESRGAERLWSRRQHDSQDRPQQRAALLLIPLGVFQCPRERVTGWRGPSTDAGGLPRGCNAERPPLPRWRRGVLCVKRRCRGSVGCYGRVTMWAVTFLSTASYLITVDASIRPRSAAHAVSPAGTLTTR